MIKYVFSKDAIDMDSPLQAHIKKKHTHIIPPFSWGLSPMEIPQTEQLTSTSHY